MMPYDRFNIESSNGVIYYNNMPLQDPVFTMFTDFQYYH